VICFSGIHMLKLASLVFLLILLFAHLVGDATQLLRLPLSMFRDEYTAPVGYTLFALLLVIGGLMLITLLRSYRYGHVCFFALTALLLLLIALTPSENDFHLFCSIVLFVLLYGYYAWQLYEAESLCLWAHLAVPGLLLAATCCHSYGLWQKSFIVYFLLVINVHHHVLSREVFPRRKSPHRHTPYTGPRRRMVFVVEPSKNWARRR
jgi:hypothetical protein